MSLRRAIVLDFMQHNDRWLTVWFIAKQTETPERTVRHVLVHLISEGVVRKDRSTYRIIKS